MMNYISLFSGIGGFELGIQKSRYKDKLNCIGFSEVDKYAISVYNRHFPKHRNFGDATRINAEELEDFELLVGGFPCQAFSLGGYRKGFNDARGTLFFEIARILKDKQPKYFLLENVKGLLHNDCGRTFQRILAILDGLGYNVQWEIYNSKHYGVPQERERVYIKGYFRTKCGNEVLSFKRKEFETDGRTIQLTDSKTSSAGSRVYSINGIFPAVRVGFNEQIMVDGKLRRLTPLEFERLQGFDDNWTKYGASGEFMSDAQRYKMCGNAVTVPVIKHIFDHWDLKE